MTPILELEHLSVELYKRRRKTELVKEVSFSVSPGHCLGILGESGSGKSMLIKAAMGLLGKGFSVSGKARFQGEDLLGKSTEELRRLRGKNIGIILQNPMTCFDPLYRIGYQISETFAVRGSLNTVQIRERSIEMLKTMRIHDPEEVLEKYPHQLSGGMLQRIMIGIASCMNPALLIADEPTTALDTITQSEILNELIRIKQENKTAMVFISHDLSAVSRIADHIVVLNQGRVADRGDFHHILHYAADPYTRLLVEKRTAVMHRYCDMLNGKERGIC